MGTHFVYEDTPEGTVLRQGDVLERTGDLVALLKKYHSHYAEQSDYAYFSVLTQSCDLVRRGGGPPKSRYIAIAPARPVEQLLRREAERVQDEWQIPIRVVGGRAKGQLSMFLQRVRQQ